MDKDVDFCYGSYYNSLWLFIDKIHNLKLRFDNSDEAIAQRKNFLITHKIGVCDIVESCEREKIDASDLGMKNITLRDVVGYLKQYPSIDTILFTGGNSKNGPEYFFRRHLKTYDLKLELVSNEIPRIHQFNLSDLGESEAPRIIKTISLTSPSGSANRAIGSLPLYRSLKDKDPKFTTFDFRVMQYQHYL
ncbi:hypothetical protein MHTCC0001_07030 [Flavobacteriaceae bacterium MHTCC 0001]